MSLEVGQQFPSATLLDQNGEPFDLGQLRGAPAVVYFYPRDDTPGCTAQACSFRDQFEEFTDAGVRVVGISDDSPKRHAAFAKRHNLPFTLLSDKGGALRKQVGNPKSMGFIPGRVTYVLDANGVVTLVFNNQWNARRHIDEALAAFA